MGIRAQAVGAGRIKFTRRELRIRSLVNDFEAIKIKIASPEEIRSWSYGEVTKPETLNYRTLRPERGGLFCEVIFGPIKDYQCACGRYKGVKYKGIICDRCGVEVTSSRVRRERMGHIELAVPVAHIWFVKVQPGYIGLVLDITSKQVEEVVYYHKYIVIDPGSSGLEKGKTITVDEYRELKSKYPDFRAGTGAQALKELLKQVDLDEEIAKVKDQLRQLWEDVEKGKDTPTKKARRLKLLKRLRVLEGMKQAGNRPEWMILDVLPVLPPDLRPMVQLEGGKFATSDLNDLYRRIINRNDRLKKLLSIKSPESVLINEMRLLQEAVDALLDNSRRHRPLARTNDRPYKSLTDNLSGKQGRFRQNLLGKRVDYSGRSVIVSGPELKFHQVGLPRRMAVELFRPFVIAELMKRGYAENIKRAIKLIEREDDRVWEVLEDVVRHHPVLLNRAPTLHRVSIQAFEPVLVDGDAIRLHPVVCPPFNADFDGDQMAVHVPLSAEAQAEACLIMLSTYNILSPAHGDPLSVPTHDMVLGIYYLTYSPEGRVGLPGAKGEGKVFASPNEAIKALENDEIDVNAAIKVKMLDHARIYKDAERIVKLARKLAEEGRNPEKAKQIEEYALDLREVMRRDKLDEGGIEEFLCVIEEEAEEAGFEEIVSIVKEDLKSYRAVETTVGRILVNRELPPEWEYVNETLNKDRLKALVKRAAKTVGMTRTAELLDRLKEIGFHWATVAGVSISVEDLMFNEAIKRAIVQKAEEEVHQVQRLHEEGRITNEERYKLVTDAWTSATNEATEIIVNNYDPLNPIYMMAFSGARGNKDQVRQLVALRGLMADPAGRIIEVPIKHNFREGLTVSEYFISSYGARKGVVDTALRTADAGYLTRRLVDVAQALVIKEEECEAFKEKYDPEDDLSPGIPVGPLEVNGKIEKTVGERVFGRYVAVDVVAPNDVYDENGRKVLSKGDVIVKAGEMVDEEKARLIDLAGVKEVVIHSPLTCRAKNGICRKCYGVDLSTGKLVNLGEAVGIIAAQSIGEPGTQLTMRTFHIGGVALARTEREQIASPIRGTVKLGEVSYGTMEDEVGAKVRIVVNLGANLEVRGRVSTHTIALPLGTVLRVADGEEVVAGYVLGEIDLKRRFVVTPREGYIAAVEALEDAERKPIKVFRPLKESTEEEVITLEIDRVVYITDEPVPDGKDPVEFAKGMVEDGKGIAIELPASSRLLFKIGAHVEEGWAIAEYPDQRARVISYERGKVKFVGFDENDMTEQKELKKVEGTILVYNPRSKVWEATIPEGADIEDYNGSYVLEDQTIEIAMEAPAGGTVTVERGKKENTIVLKAISGDIRMPVSKNVDVMLPKSGRVLKGSTIKFVLRPEGEGWLVFEKQGGRMKVSLYTEGRSYRITKGMKLMVTEGEEVEPEKILARSRIVLEQERKTEDIVQGLPKVEALFEAKPPKVRAILADHDGVVEIYEKGGKRRIRIKGEATGKVLADYEVLPVQHILVSTGAKVKRGDQLTTGQIWVKDLLRLKGVKAVQRFLVDEIQKIYKSQGVEINDKHIEVIVRQMTQRVQVQVAGDSPYLPGDIVERNEYLEIKRKLEAEGKKPPYAEPIVLGIKKAALSSESFISAASFQETPRVLSEAAVLGKVDKLEGIKENVIIGRLIPAGTGFRALEGLRIKGPGTEEISEGEELQEIAEHEPETAEAVAETEAERAAKEAEEAIEAPEAEEAATEVE